jgi:hypothetical protein
LPKKRQMWKCRSCGRAQPITGLRQRPLP